MSLEEFKRKRAEDDKVREQAHNASIKEIKERNQKKIQAKKAEKAKINKAAAQKAPAPKAAPKQKAGKGGKR